MNTHRSLRRYFLRLGSWLAPAGRAGLPWLLGLALLAAAGAPLTARAAAPMVTNLNDSGPGSLRQAITDAAPNDIITFAVTGVITLNSELSVAKTLTLSGPGAGSLALSGGNTVRVLNNSGQLTLSGLTIQNGSVGAATFGGGIFNAGVLVVRDSVVTGNKASSGGGIYSDVSGTVQVINTTLSNNRADTGDGGGLYSASFNQLQIAASTFSGNFAENDGGALLTSGSTLIVNSTLSGNHANKQGGAVYVFGGALTLNNATVVLNTDAQITGGVLVASGTAAMRNTILALNTTAAHGRAAAPNCSGTLSSGGSNLLGDNTGCTFGAVSRDQVGTGASPIAPLLSALQNNGGPTFTHLPLAGSPAIDAGSLAVPGNGGTACEGLDQRGLARPALGAASLTCDIGAVEVGASLPTSTPTPTATFTNTPLPPTDTPTNTPVPPTATATNTSVPPTDTPTNTPIPPTATATHTPVPPTDTPTNTPVPPTATATNTPVPPTDTPTNTPVPPTATATNTLVPPTATATNTLVPPTATATNTPVPPTATATNTPVPPTATATNTLVPPTATPAKTNTPIPPTLTNTPGRVKGEGALAGTRGRVTFELSVQFETGAPAPTGQLVFRDRRNGLTLRATSFIRLTLTGSHAVIAGYAVVNGRANVAFTVEVDDLGRHRPADAFRISIPTFNGYTAGGLTTNGEIQVLPARVRERDDGTGDDHGRRR